MAHNQRSLSTLQANIMSDTQTLATQIAHDGALITDFLGDYFAALTSPATRLVAAMRYASLNGGKRVRSALCLSAARLAAPGDEAALQRAIVAASALEMIHAYSLIHDDLPAMDDATMRRGKPSTHIEYDEATAILAGDALQSDAFALLSDPHYGIAPSVAVGLILELAKGSGASGMAGGQMRDLQADAAAASGNGFDAQQTEEMQAMKTGALIVAATIMGALATGTEEAQADDGLITNLRAFAAPLGLAFQVADDVLDVTANEQDMGKPVGRDKAQGKASFVDFYGLEGARRYAADLVDEGCAHISCYGNDAKALQNIAQFVINRSY